MLSITKRYNLARQAVSDLAITDDPEAFAKNDTLYLVEDVQDVVHAYAADLETLEAVYDNSYSEDIDRALKERYDEDLAGFLDRHNISYK